GAGCAAVPGLAWDVVLDLPSTAVHAEMLPVAVQTLAFFLFLIASLFIVLSGLARGVTVPLVKIHEAVRATAATAPADAAPLAFIVKSPITETRELPERLREMHEAVTERQRKTRQALVESEERLRQSQKMEAVGQLAGGVAHDFNNLLQIILACAEIAHADLPDAEPAKEEVNQILAAGKRAAQVTNQLLAFSRRQKLAPRALHPGELASRTASMLKRLVGEDIRVEVAFPPDLGSVEADGTQLEQVLVNLAINARDAMPRGGTLSIFLENEEVSEPEEPR